MRIQDLIYQLIDVDRNLFKDPTVDIFRSLMIPASNPKVVFTELMRRNTKTSPHLDKVIMDWTVKFTVPDLSSEEWFFLKLRIESALYLLKPLSMLEKGEVDARLILDDRQGHSVPWALIPFWEQFSKTYLEHFALSLAYD